MDKGNLISKLAGTQPAPVMVIEDQQTNDIIARMLLKHAKTRPDYDKIYKAFEGDDIEDVCYNLWKFCKDNFNYVIEDEEAQYVSSPYTMLTNGEVDCKNYALFIGGVLDAMKRHGDPIVWEYRFASYRTKEAPGHVFVVVNPNTDNIWVDPVLDIFNYHLYYRRAKNKRPKTAKAMGYVPRGSVGSAESDLLAALKEYSDGISNAVTVAKQQNALNTLSVMVLKSASTAIPGVSQALSLVNSGQTIISNTFGAGSLAARLASDLTKGGNILMILPNVISDVFNGRTYQTDNYWGAVYYQFYVLGRNTTDQSQVTDGDVAVGLKWFIDRLGIFISGREHIIAITTSPQDYMNLFKVNSDTTTDPVRVQAAYMVASQNFIGPPGNFAQNLRGAWANTQGVFDATILAIAQATHQSPIQVANQQGNDVYAEQYIQQSTDLITGVPNWLLIAGAAVAAYALISD